MTTISPLRLDPTRTTTLRRQFEREMVRRFTRLQKEILQLLVEEDALGLRQPVYNFDPNQPRVPKGSPEGGQWVREGVVTRKVFHGSIRDFEEFDLERAGEETGAANTVLGVFFTSDEQQAEMYAGKQGYVYENYLSFKKPLFLAGGEYNSDASAALDSAAAKFIGKPQDELTEEDWLEYRDYLRNYYDGIVVQLWNGQFNYVALSKDSILDEPIGNFDPNQPRAPKGSPTGGQWIDQTETEAFRDWFGESKVVDENGKPLVVYKAMWPYDWTKEGTGAPDELDQLNIISRTTEFPSFEPGESGIRIAGFFGDKETANKFSKIQAYRPAIYPVYLSFQKPLIIDGKGQKAGDIQFGKTGQKFRDAVRSGDYDSVIIKDTLDENTIYVALKPEQIKSATGNRGTFNPEDPDIRNSLSLNVRWRFLSSADKFSEFVRWLQRTISLHILARQHPNSEDEWIESYIEEGYRKGAGRAFDQANRPFFGMVSDRRGKAFKSQFIRAFLGARESVDKVKLLVSRAFTDLVGVTEAMAQKIRRTLADGLVQGQNPLKIAKDIHKDIETIGKPRARAIARTEIIRVHAEGQLDTFQKLGVTKLGVMSEWSTAGDNRVCKLCRPLEGIVLTVDEARGLIPRHPNCRCTFRPANVGEDQSKQVRGKQKIDRAIDRSIKAEIPKKAKRRTIKQQRRLSKWIGAGRRIAKVRPKSILDGPIGNFNPNQPRAPKGSPIGGQWIDEATGQQATGSQGDTGNRKTRKTQSTPSTSTTPLLDKLNSDKELERIRKKVIASELDYEKLGKLASQRMDIQREMDYLEGELAAIEERSIEEQLNLKVTGVSDEEAEANIAKRAEIRAQRFAKIAEIQKQWEKLNKQKEEIVAKSKALIEKNKQKVWNAMAVPKDQRMRVYSRPAGAMMTTDLDGQVVYTLDASEKFNKKLDEAKTFIRPLVADSPSLSEINFEVHNLPADRRAFHQKQRGVFVSETNPTATFVHEIGHELEWNVPGAQKAANQFLDERIARSGTPNVKLAEVFPNSGYRDHEYGNFDGFEDLFPSYFSDQSTSAAYAGKRYNSGATEVISMGLEALYEDPVRMAQKDPEYFKFIVGVLRGKL